MISALFRAFHGQTDEVIYHLRIYTDTLIVEVSTGPAHPSWGIRVLPTEGPTQRNSPLAIIRLEPSDSQVYIVHDARTCRRRAVVPVVEAARAVQRGSYT